MEPSQGGAASDRDLMARLAVGDREALAPLMERHYRRLYRLALSYLRNPAPIPCVRHLEGDDP